jgi:glycine dehydrogenase
MAALRYTSALGRLASSQFCLAQRRGLASLKPAPSLFAPLDTFPERHIGPDDDEAFKMLSHLGYDSMHAFVADTVPPKIRVSTTLVDNISIPSLSESQLHDRAKKLAGENKAFKSYIGMGYHCAVVPSVILRNVCYKSCACCLSILIISRSWKIRLGILRIPLINPKLLKVDVLDFFLWNKKLNYTSGRLESLINYQTMVMSLTSMDIANASLLDEATAAAEGMVMAFMSAPKKRTFLVDAGVTPQTIAVLGTRAKGFGINVVVGDVVTLIKNQDIGPGVCGVLIQYPDVDGHVKDFSALAETTHSLGGLVICATDLLALTKIKPPGEWGADVVVGNSGRFGVPAGYGGPHAAFFAVTDKLKRKMPGRLIGRSRDAQGNPAYRLSLQSK